DAVVATEARLVPRDRGDRERRPERPPVGQPLDEPSSDLAREVGEQERQQRRDRAPGQAALALAVEVEEQPGALVPTALEQRLRHAGGRAVRPPGELGPG